MEQIERIMQMEQSLQQAKNAAAQLEDALENFKDALPKIRMLEEYYQSDLWMQDYVDDSFGRLPPLLPREVLSQDALYDFLTDCNCLLQEMAALGRERAE